MHGTPADGGDFGLALDLAALALPCFAFSWDGLVRRRMLLYAFPVGAALGQPAALLKRIRAVLVGLLAAALGVVCLFFALGFYLLGSKRCHGSFACLVGSVEFPAWGWFAMWVGWFVLVWLRMGDPGKRVLVYGVWYHQEKVARLVDRRLGEQGLAPLPRERLYALEEGLVRLMHARGWLAHGQAWLDGGTKRTAHPVAPEAMLGEVLHEPAFRGAGDSERAAIQFLLGYFLAEAQRADRMSPLRRWWVGGGQLGRLGVYGRRAT